MEKISIRQKLFELLGSYWWVLLIIIAILAFTTDVPVFQWVLWGVGIIFALMILAPFLFQLFAPALIFVSELSTHFRESAKQPDSTRYIFIPASLLAAVGFVTAQSILSIWVLVLSFLIWASIIGFFITFIVIFFLGLAPLAILAAPFVIWLQEGFVEFLGVALFFLIALFWFGFSKMAFSENYWKTTPDNFLGYSPHTFLLGALSFQVIALPFYRFGISGVGDILSDALGFIFLILALIAALKWRTTKKSLSENERESLYRPSAWIYVLGIILTNLLYFEFEQSFGAPTSVLFWLNGFFFVALIVRFLGIFKRKKTKPRLENNT